MLWRMIYNNQFSPHDECLLGIMVNFTRQYCFVYSSKNIKPTDQFFLRITRCTTAGTDPSQISLSFDAFNEQLILFYQVQVSLSAKIAFYKNWV